MLKLIPCQKTEQKDKRIDSKGVFATSMELNDT